MGSQFATHAVSMYHRRQSTFATLQAGPVNWRVRPFLSLFLACSRIHCASRSAWLVRLFPGTFLCKWQPGSWLRPWPAATQWYLNQQSKRHSQRSVWENLSVRLAFRLAWSILYQALAKLLAQLWPGIPTLG